MKRFVKLGGLYVRPEDVVHFQESSGRPERSLVKFRDGSEWSVNMKVEAVAALLNEVKP